MTGSDRPTSDQPAGDRPARQQAGGGEARAPRVWVSGLLHQRWALVTGASRGIGLAVARALAAEMRVVMLARGAEELEARAAEIGPNALAYSCDVTDAAWVDTLVGHLRDVGGAPEIIVNNAGLFELARVEDTAPDAFARALDVNLAAPFRIIRAFVGAMRARGRGHIVTIGSIADHAIFPENGAYAASKWGLRALHEVLRAELRGSGVRTTLVSPGPTDTPLWDPVSPDDRAGFTPRAQMLPATAVADAVLYAVRQPPSVDVEEIRLGRS